MISKKKLVLCDIGNSFYHFYIDGKNFKISVDKLPKIDAKNIYYISVNEKATKKLAKKYQLINLAKFVNFKTKYNNQIGVDRIFASLSIKNGIVVDAGSAITVDSIKKFKHKGGFILLGLGNYHNYYLTISDKLNFKLNKSINLLKPPKNTQDAISYAQLKSTILIIKDFAKNQKIFFTGGDGEFLSEFFKDSTFDKNLIFKGMLKVIKKIKK